MKASKMIKYAPPYQLITVKKGHYGLSLYANQELPSEWDGEVTRVLTNRDVLVIRIESEGEDDEC
jgi:hypothetical protein